MNIKNCTIFVVLLILTGCNSASDEPTSHTPSETIQEPNSYSSVLEVNDELIVQTNGSVIRYIEGSQEHEVIGNYPSPLVKVGEIILSGVNAFDISGSEVNFDGNYPFFVKPTGVIGYVHPDGNMVADNDLNSAVPISLPYDSDDNVEVSSFAPSGEYAFLNLIEDGSTRSEIYRNDVLLHTFSVHFEQIILDSTTSNYFIVLGDLGYVFSSGNEQLLVSELPVAKRFFQLNKQVYYYSGSELNYFDAATNAFVASDIDFTDIGQVNDYTELENATVLATSKGVWSVDNLKNKTLLME